MWAKQKVFGDLTGSLSYHQHMTSVLGIIFLSIGYLVYCNVVGQVAPACVGKKKLASKIYNSERAKETPLPNIFFLYLYQSKCCPRKSRYIN